MVRLHHKDTIRAWFKRKKAFIFTIHMGYIILLPVYVWVSFVCIPFAL